MARGGSVLCKDFLWKEYFRQDHEVAVGFVRDFKINKYLDQEKSLEYLLVKKEIRREKKIWLES